MRPCLTCGSDQKQVLLDLGRQPVSSHFTASANISVAEHDLALACCGRCGLVQLAEPFPFQDLMPLHPWMTYREPEAHLDAVVERICALPRLTNKSRLAGVTFKDVTTLDRFRKRGYSNIWSLDPGRDLAIDHPNARIESVQALLTPRTAADIVARRGPVDVLIARHIVEHAASPRQLMAALSVLLSTNGYLILEVPDCTANLERQDYSMIWEEHTAYFTPETFPGVLAPAGCASRGHEIYPFPFEDVIVLYAQKVEGVNGEEATAPPEALRRNGSLARAYAAAFGEWTARYRSVLAKLTADGRPVAAYGAGHLTCAFINLHGLSDYFVFVVDDTPHKQGLFLPRSGLPIVPRDRLTAQNVSACLLGLAPQLEDKIIGNNTQFSHGGGRFYSMFADSPRTIRHLV